jgi:hypothetical protein
MVSFTIILLDRQAEDSVVQPLCLQVDPDLTTGSKKKAGWLRQISASGTDRSDCGETAETCLIGEIVVEMTKFESQEMENLEIAGVEYQRATLSVYTVRARGPEKRGYK